MLLCLRAVQGLNGTDAFKAERMRSFRFQNGCVPPIKLAFPEGNLKMQISMSIWLQVVLVMRMLVTHLGQILVVIAVSFQKCFSYGKRFGL